MGCGKYARLVTALHVHEGLLDLWEVARESWEGCRPESEDALVRYDCESIRKRRYGLLATHVRARRVQSLPPTGQDAQLPAMRRRPQRQRS